MKIRESLASYYKSNIFLKNVIYRYASTGINQFSVCSLFSKKIYMYVVLQIGIVTIMHKALIIFLECRSYRCNKKGYRKILER